MVKFLVLFFGFFAGVTWDPDLQRKAVAHGFVAIRPPGGMACHRHHCVGFFDLLYFDRHNRLTTWWSLWPRYTGRLAQPDRYPVRMCLAHDHQLASLVFETTMS